MKGLIYMTSQNIRKMVTTAILIALTIVFQLLRPVLGGSNIISTYIIGSLVNVVLMVSACAVGLWSGIAVSVITPLIALWQNHATLPMLPWIIAGNLVLVLIFALWALKDKSSLKVEWVRWIIVGVIAMLVKFVVMAYGQGTVIAGSFTPASAALFTAAGKQSVQLITAAIATVLAGIILPSLSAAAGKKASR